MRSGHGVRDSISPRTRQAEHRCLLIETAAPIETRHACTRPRPRPLLPEGADLLDATRAAESLGCAVAIVGPGSMGASQAGAAGSSSGCAAALLYANAAAAAALGVDSCSQHGTPPTVWLPECAAGCEVSATGACLAEEAVAWRPCVRSEACPDDGSRSTATDGSSTDSSKGRTCGGSSVADGVGASGSSGEHTAGASSSGELEVDRLLVCPLTAPNGEMAACRRCLWPCHAWTQLCCGRRHSAPSHNTITIPPGLLALPLAHHSPTPLHTPDSAVGLALLFDGWRYPSDGALGRPGFPRVAPAELPDQARLQAAADGVRQQADHVRELKQQQGLANQVGCVQRWWCHMQRSTRQNNTARWLQWSRLPFVEHPLLQHGCGNSC